MVSAERVGEFLDRELHVTDFKDSSNNGLQVDNSGRVGRVCCGVDASLEFFEAAQRRGADMLICHHGLSWNDSLKRITDLNYRKIAFLMRHDMALYACHLPLDAHPRYGNNAVLARMLNEDEFLSLVHVHPSEKKRPRAPQRHEAQTHRPSAKHCDDSADHVQAPAFDSLNRRGFCPQDVIQVVV